MENKDLDTYHYADFLVIGSGIAGLSFALKVASLGKVVIVTKKESIESSTNYAQGGIAVALSPDDSFEAHKQDTLISGDGLCHPEIVDLVVREGPDRIKELVEMGIQFSLSKGDGDRYDLGREGGHSQRRIVHSTDATGRELERGLLAQVESNPNIEIYENYIAIDLITQSKIGKATAEHSDDGETCFGAYVLNIATGKVHTFVSQITFLATGGAGKVYFYTSNPDISTGDGIAVAYRIGAKIADMEFIQFHPTCLYHPQERNFLITEALRGEGGILKLRDGTPFMKKHHPLGELASRDIVARAIDFELKKSGDETVFLDISHKDPEFVKERFPNIFMKCLSVGIDITKEPIPVVPAAHYLCGGVLTNQYGETSIKRLYAGGEVTCTGLHGANRLASNSLLEALVFAHRSSIKVKKEIERGPLPIPTIPPWDHKDAVDIDEAIVISHNWDEIRRLMWNYVGIVRSNKRLMRAKRRIELLQSEIDEYYQNFTLTSDLIELRNIATIAELIIDSALARKESRGLHFNMDYPHKDDQHWKKDTVLELRDGKKIYSFLSVGD